MGNYKKKNYNKSCYFFYFRSDPFFHETDPDPEPYQNETDPQHCLEHSGNIYCQKYALGLYGLGDKERKRGKKWRKRERKGINGRKRKKKKKR